MLSVSLSPFTKKPILPFVLRSFGAKKKNVSLFIFTKKKSLACANGD